MTGIDEAALNRHLAEGTTFEDFFPDAQLNPQASLITGVVCGVRVEDLNDPLMQKIGSQSCAVTRPCSCNSLTTEPKKASNVQDAVLLVMPTIAMPSVG